MLGTKLAFRQKSNYINVRLANNKRVLKNYIESPLTYEYNLLLAIHSSKVTSLFSSFVSIGGKALEQFTWLQQQRQQISSDKRFPCYRTARKGKSNRHSIGSWQPFLHIHWYRTERHPGTRWLFIKNNEMETWKEIYVIQFECNGKYNTGNTISVAFFHALKHVEKVFSLISTTHRYQINATIFQKPLRN